MVSNNAVAVVITPLAISIAAQLGMDPRPLVVAVMVAASAEFCHADWLSNQYAGLWAGWL
jgi:di/tricarboxylate transporter